MKKNKRRNSVLIHLNKNDSETNHIKVFDSIVQDEVKKIEEFYQIVRVGQQEYKDANRLRRIEETENQIRMQLRLKHEQHHYQSTVSIDNVAMKVDNSDYNKELLKGRYQIMIKKDRCTSTEVLKQIANEEVAFQLYKNRDYITKAPTIGFEREEQEKKQRFNMLEQIVADNLKIESDTEGEPEHEKLTLYDRLKLKNKLASEQSSMINTARSGKQNTIPEIQRQEKFDTIDLKKKRYDSFLNPSFLSEYMNIRKGHIYANEQYGEADKPLNSTTATKVNNLVKRFTKHLNHQEISNLLTAFLEKSLNKTQRKKVKDLEIQHKKLGRESTLYNTKMAVSNQLFNPYESNTIFQAVKREKYRQVNLQNKTLSSLSFREQPRVVRRVEQNSQSQRTIKNISQQLDEIRSECKSLEVGKNATFRSVNNEMVRTHKKWDNFMAISDNLMKISNQIPGKLKQAFVIQQRDIKEDYQIGQEHVNEYHNYILEKSKSIPIQKLENSKNRQQRINVRKQMKEIMRGFTFL